MTFSEGRFRLQAWRIGMKRWLCAGIVLSLLGLALVQAEGQVLYPFDPKTVETLQGIVVNAPEFKPGGITEMVHLTLKTKREKLIVILAPNWFMAQQNWNITDLDSLEVTGSRLNLHGQTALVAQMIKKGDQVMVFRDKTGRPLWFPPQRKTQ
jgi:hypothetical protein